MRLLEPLLQFVLQHGKPVLCGVILQPMFLQWLDFICSGKCQLRSSKLDMMRAFASVSFLWCWFIAIFNFRRTTYNQSKKTQYGFYVIFSDCLVSHGLFVVVATSLLDNYCIHDALWVSFLKKDDITPWYVLLAYSATPNFYFNGSATTNTHIVSL